MNLDRTDLVWVVCAWVVSMGELSEGRCFVLQAGSGGQSMVVGWVSGPVGKYLYRVLYFIFYSQNQMGLAPLPAG